MNTIFITGCSSGFGLETARYFLARDWQVIGTMRTLRPDVLPRSERLRLLTLDVTKPESIRRAVEQAGPVDVLVNNAGIGLLSVFEATPIELMRAAFETNVFGALALTQAFVPSFRARGSGVIVNVSSSTTMKPLPLLAVYTATKAALNKFSESLALELAPFGVRTSLVLPGQSPDTSFGDNARACMREFGVEVPPAYADFVHGVLAGMAGAPSESLTAPSDVAETIWRVVHDPSAPLRQPAGADALALL